MLALKSDNTHLKVNGDQPQHHVLLLGTETLLNEYIAKELALRQIKVTVLVRNMQPSQRFPIKTAAFKMGTITPQRTPQDIFSGIHAVISTLEITTRKKTIFDIGMGYRTHLKLMEDAQKAGIKKLVFVTDLSSSMDKTPELALERSIFMHRLKASGMDYTVLHIDGLFSDLIPYFHKGHTVKTLFFSNSRKKFRPIHSKELASFCAAALYMEQNEVILKGPKPLNQKEIRAMAFTVPVNHLITALIPKPLDRFFQWFMNSARFYKRQTSPRVPTKMG